MSAREVIKESAAVGFVFGSMTAIYALVKSKGDIKESAACGAAIAAAATACIATFSLLDPEDDRDKDKSKYIDERAEESN